MAVGGSVALAWANPAPDFGPTSGGTTVTLPVPSKTIFTQVDASSYYTVAFDQDGYTYAWGSNVFGQLGDGTTTDRLSPVQVATPPGVNFYTQVDAGFYHALAIGDDGNTYAWGWN